MLSSRLMDKVIRVMECVHSLDGNFDEREIMQVIDTLKWLEDDDLEEINNLPHSDDYHYEDDEDDEDEDDNINPNAERDIRQADMVLETLGINPLE